VRRALELALLLAGVAGAAGVCACAGAQGAGAITYRFPQELRASQVVVLESEGERHEFIASVRRAGADVEVTLFDPVFAVPLLHARAQGGEVTEELLAPGPRPGDGKRLAGLLRDVFSRGYAETDGAARADGWMGKVRLAGLPAEPGECRFPEEIELRPRAGGAVVQVKTLDVACGGEP
jgi:hypothetical protein